MDPFITESHVHMPQFIFRVIHRMLKKKFNHGSLSWRRLHDHLLTLFEWKKCRMRRGWVFVFFSID
jgi:hypothetical protein